MLQRKILGSRKNWKNQSRTHREKALWNAIEGLEERVLLAYTLDPSFSGDGMIETPKLEDVAVMADNKIMGATITSFTSPSTVSVYRYNADGSTDMSYGSGGVVAVHPPFVPQTRAIIGNKIYIAGDTGDNVTQHFMLARYNLDGTLDTSFGGGDGVADAVLDGDGGGTQTILVAPDGDIIVGGYTEITNTFDLQASVARFNSDGSMDTTFGGDGTVQENIFAKSLGTSAYTLAPSGDLFTTTSYFDNSGQFTQVFRFSRTGAVSFSPQLQPWAFQSGGKSVAINGKQLVRYNADYTTDSTFNGNGLNLGANDSIHDVLALSDDRLLVIGSTASGAANESDGFIARLLANGAPDTSFALNGILRFDQGFQDNSPNDIDVAPDGRLVVTNWFKNPSDTDWRYGLVRFAESSGPSQSPFLGTPFNVNSTIQAEDFDNGGEGVAYHDTDATNNGGAYRPNEAVDIEATSDTGGGFDVGWTIPGEWMEYTFNVPTAGTYTINTRLASPKTGGSFHYQVDDATSSGPISIPNTGSFQSFRTITSNLGQLSAGTHVLRLAIDAGPNPGGQANFNWMKINSTGDTQAPGGVPNFHSTNVTNSSVSLAWDAATDNVGVTGYEISSDAFPPTLLGPDQRSFTYNELAPDRQYTFSIHAIDAAGNQGPTSQVSATTGSLPVTGGLKGEYFNNMDFTAPVLTRTDANIDFNWGTGAPASGMDPDTFSVRWTGKVSVPTTGRYTFYTTTDDGVRLWVNNQLIIDKFVPQAATEWSGSIDLVAGQKYDIRMDYFERAGGAQAKLSWSGPGIAKQIVPPSAFSGASSTNDTQPPSSVPNFMTTGSSNSSIAMRWDAATDNVGVAGYELRINDGNPIILSSSARNYTAENLQQNTQYKFTISAFDAAGNHGPVATQFVNTTQDTSAPGNGLKGEYFNNMDFTAPVFTRTDPTINFNWGTGSPDSRIDPDTFSVRWTGFISVPTSGRYTFYTTSDDGMRLTINGQRIIDKLGPQSTTEWSGSIDLLAGQKYEIKLEYIERAGGANAKLQWSGPNISKQVVPQANLFS